MGSKIRSAVRHTEDIKHWMRHAEGKNKKKLLTLHTLSEKIRKS